MPLDNFEHLIQAGLSVPDLLAMAPNLEIIVTSQAALQLYGEPEFPLAPAGAAGFAVEILIRGSVSADFRANVLGTHAP